MRWLLIIVTTCIIALGLVMIFSTTSAEVLDHDLDKSTHQALLKQIYFALFGAALGIVVYTWGYRRLIANSPAILLTLTIALIAVLIPGIGREVNGSRRWLLLAGVSFQPSEFVKYLVPAFFIHSL